MKKLILFALIALLMISAVQALGVAPATKTIMFEPATLMEGHIRIINNEMTKTKVAVYPKGGLTQYFSMEQESFTIEEGQSDITVPYSLLLPQKMEPGTHELELFVVEQGQQTGQDDFTIIDTNLGVIHKIYVYVPAPGKHLNGLLFIDNTLPGEEVQFTITLTSLGDQPINEVQGTLLITDFNNNPVTTITTTKIELPPKERSKIVGKWQADVEPGTYNVQAIVNYDEKVHVLETKFDLGEALVNIRDIKVADFNLGNIARFDIILESLWNNEIKEVKTTTQIFDERSLQVGLYEAAPTAIPPLGAKEVTSYWETENIQPDEYVFRVKMNYLGRTKEKNYAIDVSEEGIEFKGQPFTGQVIQEDAVAESNNGSLIGLLAGLVIILGIVVGVLYTKKKPKSNVYKPQPRQQQPEHQQIHQQAAHQQPSLQQPNQLTLDQQAKIKNYITFNMQQGISIKALKQRLVQKGYDEMMIDNIILEIEEEQSGI